MMNATATLPAELTDFFGAPISVYSREQAIADGELVDVTEWASADKGFIGGYTCPVAFTRQVWAAVEVTAKSRRSGDTRGRAHDVLWMSSLALRGILKRGGDRATFRVRIGNRNHIMMAVADGDGITIGYRENF